MKHTKYIWCKLFLFISLSAFLYSCSDSDEYIDVTEITVDQETIILDVGETIALNVTINPSNASVKRYEWSSENSQIAKVSTSGVVTGVSGGTTKVIVKTPLDGYTAEVLVTVNGPELPPAMKIEGEYRGIVKWGGTPAAQNVPLLIKRISESKVSIEAEATIAALGLTLKVHGNDITIAENEGSITLSGVAITDDFGFGDKETKIKGVIDQDGNITLDLDIDSISEEVQYVGSKYIAPEVELSGKYSGDVTMAGNPVAQNVILTIDKLSETKAKLETTATTPFGPLHIHGDNMKLEKDDRGYKISGTAITDDFGYGDKETKIKGHIDFEGNIELTLNIDSVSEEIGYKGKKKELELFGDYSGIATMAGTPIAQDVILKIEKLSETKAKLETTPITPFGPLHIHGNNMKLEKDGKGYKISGTAITDDYGYGDKDTDVKGTIDENGNITLDIKIDSIDEKIGYKGKRV